MRIEERQKLFDLFIEASVELNNELMSKKFDPTNKEAYLSCFLSVETIMNFNEALTVLLENEDSE